MFDLNKDPNEMVNVYQNPEYSATRTQLSEEYERLRREFEAPNY